MSLGGLLKRISKNSGVLSRERYIEAFLQHAPEDDLDFFRQEAHTIYSAKFGGDGDELDIKVLEGMCDRLDKASGAVGSYADKVVAHIDMDAHQLPSVTFADIDRAIDGIGSVFRSVSLLVGGKNVVTLEPTVQGDWKRPLRSPLFPSGH